MPGTVGRVPAPQSPEAGPAPVVPVPPLDRSAWQHTPLGPSHRWEPGLRAVIELLLACPVAMAFGYRDDLSLIYNDAFAALIGRRHPDAFGRPAADVFADIWRLPGVGDVIDRVRRTGEPFLEKEAQFPFTDETSGTVFTRGISAVRDATGQIVGILAVVAETTQVTRRLQNLSELTSALAGTLTLDDVARVTLRNAMASFDADQIALAVDDGAGWRMVRRIRGELLDDADERLPPVWRRLAGDSPAPLVLAAAAGASRYVGDGRPLAGSALDRHDEKVRALVTLPLRTPSLRGALTIGYQQARLWSPAERAQLSASAELVAQAAERARRFETQHGTAQLLQRSMLPEHLPDLPRLRLAARYDAGVDGNAAGGDFYDAFRLPGGGLAVVLGDVVGHDVRAAALMGQVRAALRALALGEPDPSAVLAGLDRLVASLGTEADSEELFVTVLYGVVEPDRGRLTLANAGHPPALIRRQPPGGESVAEYVDLSPGPPLGLGGRRRTGTVDFRPGDALLMFSDGVVERRRHPIDTGLATLSTAVAGAPGRDPRALCALALGAVPGATEDDVAVLAVEHALMPSRSASLEVPAEPTAPSRVRHWMTAQLTGWRVPEPVIGAAVLCASELTTNALLHAGTAARVEIDLSTERLLVSVADRGTRGTVIRARTETLSSRGRGLGLIEELSDAWGTDPTVRGSTVWFEILIPKRVGPASTG